MIIELVIKQVNLDGFVLFVELDGVLNDERKNFLIDAPVGRHTFRNDAKFRDHELQFLLFNLYFKREQVIVYFLLKLPFSFFELNY